MGKKQRRRLEKAGTQKHNKPSEKRAWLVPVLVLVGALAFIALALVAAADK